MNDRESCLLDFVVRYGVVRLALVDVSGLFVVVVLCLGVITGRLLFVVVFSVVVVGLLVARLMGKGG